MGWTDRPALFLGCLLLLTCTCGVQCQLKFNETVNELIASGKLQNATQTAAGYTAQTLCSGETVATIMQSGSLYLWDLLKSLAMLPYPSNPALSVRLNRPCRADMQ